MLITIIGAGIGGLSTALALEKKGFTIEIYEQANELKSVGAGIILGNNAMQVYKHLGIATALKQFGHELTNLSITDSHFNILSRTNLSYYSTKYKVPTLAIHRGQLQTTLLNSLQNTTIHLGHKVVSISKNDSNYSITFENGITIQRPLIIGADGIHSSIRKYIFPKSCIRSTHQICYRGIAHYSVPKMYKQQLYEAWGTNARFGFVPIDKNSVYWYAIKKSDTDFNVSFTFKDFHPIVPTLIANTNLDYIHKSEMTDLAPLKYWYKDSICLIGDAAHATTPNMGQGACQAIEDAYNLAECFNLNDISNSFKKFQKTRIKKISKVVRTSRILGQIAHIKYPLLTNLRNQILKTTPNSLQQKQLDMLFKLTM